MPRRLRRRPGQARFARRLWRPWTAPRGVAESIDGVGRDEPDLAGRLIHDVTMSAARSVIASPERLREVTENLRLFLHQGFAAR